MKKVFVVFMILVAISFIPFVYECGTVSDMCIAKMYYPYQPHYWKDAYLTLTGEKVPGVIMDWESFGNAYILREGIGDAFREISNMLR
ncbi:MAG: hypothetical protein ABIT47_02255 [Candidatus Paceibacterota bacterium]